MEAFELESFLKKGIIAEFFQNFRTIVPGKVISVSGNVATIQVAIQDLDASGNPIEGEVTLYSVPIMMLGGSSNYVTCQISTGDLGLLLVCDRDITAFKSSQQISPVSSFGVANLEYSLFLPGSFLPAYAGVKLKSSTSVLAQVGSNTINLTSSGAVVTIGSSTLNISSSAISWSAGGASINMSGGNIALTGNVIINSALTIGTGGNVTGDLTIDGKLESNDDILVNSISLKTHVHGGVTTGSENTGAPE
jgi:hypothetical protein